MPCLKENQARTYDGKTDRSTHRRYSVKKGVLRNFAKFTGKHLCQSLFFNEFFNLFFIKKETLSQVSSCELCEISKNTFSTEHLRTVASELIKTKIKCCLKRKFLSTMKISSEKKLRTLHKKWSFFLRISWANPKFLQILSHLLKKSLIKSFTSFLGFWLNCLYLKAVLCSLL